MPTYDDARWSFWALCFFVLSLALLMIFLFSRSRSRRRERNALSEANLLGTRLAAAQLELSRLREVQGPGGDDSHEQTLPDQPAFELALEKSLQRAKRQGKGLVAMQLQIEQLPQLRSQYGEDVSHFVVRQVSERLAAALRRSDFLAHTGSGHFLLCLESLADLQPLNGIVRKLQEAANHVFCIDSQDVPVSASLGGTIPPIMDASVGSMLRQSEDALTLARRQGQGQTAFVPGSLQSLFEQQRNLHRYFRKALQENQFTLRVNQYAFERQGALQVVGLGIEPVWQHPVGTLYRQTQLEQLARACGVEVQWLGWLNRALSERLTEWMAIHGKKWIALPNVTGWWEQPGQMRWLCELTESMDRSRLLVPVNAAILTRTEAQSDAARDFREACSEAGFRLCVDNLGEQPVDLMALASLTPNAIQVCWQDIQYSPDPGRSMDLFERLRLHSRSLLLINGVDDERALERLKSLPLKNTALQGSQIEQRLNERLSKS